MDGTNLTKIVETKGITTITIDPINAGPCIYWANDDGSIESSDYHGENRNFVRRIFSNLVSFAVSNNTFAWLTQPTWTSPGYLFISRNLENMPSTHVKPILFHNPTKIKPVSSQSIPMGANNACKDNNACQHLCFLNTALVASCACHLGWQLNSDSKSCRSTNEFILYTQGDFIRGKTMGVRKEAFTDAISPIQIQKVNLQYKRTIDFDYDLLAGIFLYSDIDTIYHEDIIDIESPTRIRKFKQSGFRSIAVDWVTGNVYVVTDTERFVSPHIKIYNHRLDNDVFKRIPLNLQGYRPRSLVVHPNRGYLFFIASRDEGTYVKIFRMNADGSMMKEIAKDELISSDPTELGIAIDYERDRVYWVCGPLVRHANLDGDDVTIIDISIVENPRSISVHQELMYISNLTSIWRFHKQMGNPAIRIAPIFGNSVNQPISGVKVYSPKLQNVNYEHPCAINNGDCKDFCFAVPKTLGNGSLANNGELQRVCACHIGKEIEYDGTSCL